MENEKLTYVNGVNLPPSERLQCPYGLRLLLIKCTI